MANYPEPAAIVSDQETVSDTALSLADFTGISAANVLAATRLWLVVNTNAVRIRYDGTAPTVSVGAKLSSGRDLLLFGANQIANFKIIRDDTSDAEVFVVLEG